MSRYRITLEGKVYEMTVEVVEENKKTASAHSCSLNKTHPMIIKENKMNTTVETICLNTHFVQDYYI